MNLKYLLTATALTLAVGCIALAKQQTSQQPVSQLGKGSIANSVGSPGAEAQTKVDMYARLIAQQGQTALDHKRYAEAESLARKAIQVQPLIPQAWMLLADVSERQGKLEQALQAYHALVYAPNGSGGSMGTDPVTLMRYVLALTRSNRYADAVQVYDKARLQGSDNSDAALFPLRFDASNPDENHLQAAAHYVMGIKRPLHRDVAPDELQQHLQAAIRLAPDWGKPHAALGKMLDWRRQPQAAEVEYVKARQLGEPVESLKQYSERISAEMRRKHDLAHPELHATNGVSIPLKFSDAQIKQWIANSQTDMSKNEQLLKEIKKANAAQTATSQAQPKL